MKLIIDIGNSSINSAVFYEHDSWSKIHTIDSTSFLYTEKYVTFFLDLRAEFTNRKKFDKEVISCIISSVVPELTHPIKKIVKQTFGIDALIASNILQSPLNQRVPKELGTDLFANAVASYVKSNKLDSKNTKKSKTHYASITVDLGTALTFTAVDQEGKIAGVVICPGLYTSYKALIQNTALLDFKQLTYPKSVLGMNTKDSINAGVLVGYTHLIQGLLTEMKASLKKPIKVYAKGGSLFLIQSALLQKKVIDEIDIYHTLHGLLILLDYYLTKKTN